LTFLSWFVIRPGGEKEEKRENEKIFVNMEGKRKGGRTPLKSLFFSKLFSPRKKKRGGERFLFLAGSEGKKRKGYKKFCGVGPGKKKEKGKERKVRLYFCLAAYVKMHRKRKRGKGVLLHRRSAAA